MTEFKSSMDRLLLKAKYICQPCFVQPTHYDNVAFKKFWLVHFEEVSQVTVAAFVAAARSAFRSVQHIYPQKRNIHSIIASLLRICTYIHLMYIVCIMGV
jgi:hypothetical protein